MENLRFLSAVGINAANIKIQGIMSQPAPKAELAPMTLIADIATIITRVVSISKDISNLPGLSSTYSAGSKGGRGLVITLWID